MIRTKKVSYENSTIDSKYVNNDKDIVIACEGSILELRISPETTHCKYASLLMGKRVRGNTMEGELSCKERQPEGI